MVPDFVTHYHLPDHPPFANLSDLGDSQLTEVMVELTRRRREGAHHRRFGRTYMEMRRLTEARLFQWFTDAGGHPDRRSPHYFVLGESPWFRGLAIGMQELRLPLAALPRDKASATYPDSFTATGVASEFGLPHEHHPHHGRVYLLDELPELISRCGLPAPEADRDYAGYELRGIEAYIEIQLWSDEPVQAFLDEDR